MININDYFEGRIFCINVAARTDRRQHAERLFARFGIAAQFFDAYSGLIDHEGRKSGNYGCTASHRALLEVIAFNRWPRTLILEDDVDIIYSDFHERFDRFVTELPADWDFAYLGAGYGEPPIARVSPHVIRAGRLLTTSSYAITWQMARTMAPYISGVGPIDSLYGGFHRNAKTYIVSPRICVQYPNHSDLQEQFSGNAASMLDRAMEAQLP